MAGPTPVGTARINVVPPTPKNLLFCFLLFQSRLNHRWSRDRLAEAFLGIPRAAKAIERRRKATESRAMVGYRIA